MFQLPDRIEGGLFNGQHLNYKDYAKTLLEGTYHFHRAFF